MYLYVKSMYIEWCRRLDRRTRKDKHEEFIKLAAECFSYSEEHMSEYLKNTDWFCY